MENLENWRDVVGYEGNYQVSDYGRVRRISQKGKSRKGNRVFPTTYFTLKGAIGKNGYPVVALSKDAIVKTCTIHSLVARAFLCTPNFKADVNHKDNIKTNNHISNLEYVTHRSNTSHGFKTIGGYSSQYVGVSYVKSRNKWSAALQVNGRHKFLGHFLTEIEAADAYRIFISENNIINSYA